MFYLIFGSYANVSCMYSKIGCHELNIWVLNLFTTNPPIEVKWQDEKRIVMAISEPDKLMKELNGNPILKVDEMEHLVKRTTPSNEYNWSG